MIDKILQELIEFVNNSSPVIWQAFYRQVYVDAITYFLWTIGLIAISIVLFRVSKWCKMKEENQGQFDDYGVWRGITLGFGIAFDVAAFGLFIEAFRIIANPQFYAIQYILQSISGK